MRRFTTVVLLLFLSVPSSSCQRTVYTHLHGNGDERPAKAPVSAGGRWQHFFIFGWVPGEKVIESEDGCGKARVAEIRTRRTFVQGLVAAVAGFYINIYSPWTGETLCETRS
jgi:hypothetical protein